MAHSAELIAVGTELLLGNIVNTDAQFLSQGLAALGIDTYYHTVVGDNPDRLRAAVQLARSRADIIITTGGLGPTCDDLTKTVLAESFGLPLAYHEPSARRIEAYFEKLHPGRPMTQNNYQQAMLPQGCTVLDNDWGTAPGVAFVADGIHVFMLPGPPRECKAMFQHRVIPLLRELSGGIIVSRTLKFFGIGESALEAQLRDEMNAMTNPTLAPYGKEGECELRITAKAETEDAAAALIAPVEAQLREKFGSLIYGADLPSLEAAVLPLLLRKGLTLGTAESCTGGLIAKRITDLPGASAAFLGGVVSYSSQVKQDVLRVPQALLAEHGAVSEPVARAMAEGARALLGCDLAVSATGVAGPDSDDRGNPVGLVYLALAAPEGTWVRKIQVVPGVRERVRHLAASSALHMAWQYLSGLDVN